ncbi:Gfo/Idh/MocA family oxidoreductase [Rhodopirellula sp. JC740]|uniref:Gfo/Idh/MocA family oxidoreductase n=1 Tax=Rhodopirellula halodulae TaxID=2894198 RepID=A0ABS8NNG5_9BACT|nr:Gfo/Idh/MocA family oxidoreductase [Rhodopirellula sp. JC740]MCC9645128.1 Gfo/Idh/MocA family oxidoreductase [Rhodopirellula sp. JC740]
MPSDSKPSQPQTANAKRIAADSESQCSAASSGDSDSGQRSSVLNQRASRRCFIQSGGIMLAGGSVLTPGLDAAEGVHASGSDVLKIGLIGCGSRGTQTVIQALQADPATQLVAMADVYESQLHSSFRAINGRHADRVQVEGQRFVGLDAWRQVINSDADIVYLMTPPGFRPLQFEKAVDAGKHVFMEKPVATDAPGVRRVLRAGKRAKQKGLAVAVGLQRHHDARYRETIDRLQDGAIGDLIYARAYWNGSGAKINSRRNVTTELDHQLRHWRHFDWIGGDPIVEQHVHNLDVINWLFGQHPVTAQGQGGRDPLANPNLGDSFDHHMIEFAYAGDKRLLSQCRRARGCWNNIGEHVHGTNGSCDLAAGTIRDFDGNVIWKSDSATSKDRGSQQMQTDFFVALRSGTLPNEVEYAATSTMTAIMGRMASHSGKLVRWNDALNSQQRLADVEALQSLRCPAPVLPLTDGTYETATPGQTKVV